MTPLRTSLSFVAVGMLGLGVGSNFAQQAREPTRSELQTQLITLLKERRDVARQRVEVLQASFDAGVIQQEQLVNAHADLLRAELDLSQTKAERVAVHRKLVETLVGFEKVVKAMHEAGRVGGHLKDVLSVKRARLDAEIGLVREQMK